MAYASSLESDEQERKLFVGGLNKAKTDEEDLKQYFQQYGNIVDCTIMRDGDKMSRGFGFVLFEHSAAVDDIIASKKEGKAFLLDDHHIEVKRALPKVPGGNAGTSRTGGLYRKIFVGGLPSTITEDELRKHFERFGRVNEVELLRDRETNRLRGFAFVTFDEEDSADKCIQRRSHEICKKICEVKRAQTRSTLIENEDRRRDHHHQGNFHREDRHHHHSAPNTGHHPSSNSSGLSMAEVNQLIQQAFTMGQQSVLQQTGVQAPTAATLLGLANPPQSSFPPPPVNNSQLLQALINQQAISPAPAPVAPPPTAPQAGALSQLARILQQGQIDPNALSALLKQDSDNNPRGGVPPQKNSNNGGYSTAYPPTTAYDLYYGQTNSSYGPSKDDPEPSKRSYRPY